MEASDSLRQKKNKIFFVLYLTHPHVFRHTFCTNMANAGMDLKSLQYLMGHSDASVTLNVYTHNSYEKAEESMAQIMSFSGRQQEEKKLRCFG